MYMLKNMMLFRPTTTPVMNSIFSVQVRNFAKNNPGVRQGTQTQMMLDGNANRHQENQMLFFADR